MKLFAAILLVTLVTWSQASYDVTISGTRISFGGKLSIQLRGSKGACPFVALTTTRNFHVSGDCGYINQLIVKHTKSWYHLSLIWYRPTITVVYHHGDRRFTSTVSLSGWKKITTTIFNLKVSGGWSTWRTGSCSRTCGNGNTISTRTCNNPTPRNSGSPCYGPRSILRGCKLRECPVNGRWGVWSEYTVCSATCGVAFKTRSRECNNPTPTHGGRDCNGASIERTECPDVKCPINGGWSDWQTSPCKATCGIGEKIHTRECNNPRPQYGGEKCSGNSKETLQCNEGPCPINGGWSEWQTSPCKATCGLGEKIHTRECNNPRPQYGGATCSGNSEEILQCDEGPCPIEGGWGNWTDYSACSTTCGLGQTTRSRRCDNPSPLHGGKNCTGEDTESKTCNEKECPIDGHWGEWTEYGNCSTTCDQGIKTRTRECNNPAPLHDGNQCTGDNTESIQCEITKCPINGGWGNWSEFSACSTTCGPGQKRQSRECNNPEPQYGGEGCRGNQNRNRDCIIEECPADVPSAGAWSEWSGFGPCSVTCGPGIEEKTRKCDNPPPKNGGEDCKGYKRRTRKCKDSPPCPDVQ